jgi:hypothetical protein
MKYFDEMCNKFGFDDGDAEPQGMRAYRHVYVAGMNALLAARQSAVRVTAWNRPGMHNGCMIVPVTVDFCATLDPQHILDGDHLPTGWSVTDDGADALDDAYWTALGDARDLELEQYVVVTATIDTAGLEGRLTAIFPF